MVTSLGKELRKLRIDRGEVLRDMAEKLSISSAYLSSIENGKRRASESLVEKIGCLYSLSNAEKQNLWEAWQKSIDEVTIDLRTSNGTRRDLGLVFARKFDGLSDEDVQKLMTILGKENNE